MDRLHEEKCNNQGCLMKIVEYNSHNDMIIEFQDECKYRMHTQYCNFQNGNVKNPYYPSVYGVGITGLKYPRSFNCRITKEYNSWFNILQRSFSENEKNRSPYYKDVTCCEEWFLFENFYEWLHNQDNFDKWYSGKRWAIDKDIIVKGNKLYSPDTCCLVPQNVNCLLLKRDALRGEFPIGVKKRGDKFEANCGNPFTRKREHLGVYDTPEEAFLTYKIHRENYIKQVAEIEYKSGNITKPCYEALINYSIDIDD